jgi:hypothetical protein
MGKPSSFKLHVRSRSHSIWRFKILPLSNVIDLIHSQYIPIHTGNHKCQHFILVFVGTEAHCPTWNAKLTVRGGSLHQHLAPFDIVELLQGRPQIGQIQQLYQISVHTEVPDSKARHLGKEWTPWICLLPEKNRTGEFERDERVADKIFPVVVVL